jgi:ferredoxin-NADP reductase
VDLVVQRLEDGEVSPYLTDILRAGDQFELRGPIGGYFVWHADLDSPLQLVAGGSGVAPFLAMLDHHAAAGSARWLGCCTRHDLSTTWSAVHAWTSTPNAASV